MIAMIAGSALTLAFAAVSARLSRTGVGAVLLGAGAAAAVTAVFAHSPVVLFLAIGLAVFSPTSDNATQSMTAASAVPEGRRPTGIGVFLLAHLMGGALGPALATLLVLG